MDRVIPEGLLPLVGAGNNGAATDGTANTEAVAVEVATATVVQAAASRHH